METIYYEVWRFISIFFMVTLNWRFYFGFYRVFKNPILVRIHFYVFRESFKVLDHLPSILQLRLNLKEFCKINIHYLY